MLKLEIKLDDEKIVEERQYRLEDIYMAIDRVFEQYHLTKKIQPDGTIVFYGNGKTEDYGSFGRLITTLKDKDWFINYVTKWMWYNSDDDNDFSTEDVLYHYTHKKSVA